MAETIKSALFVDYDSLYRRLADTDSDAAAQFGERVGAWVGAVESGGLVTPATAEGVRRRILIRRCYANPETLGGARAAFVASGFEMIDCPLQEGRDRSPADVHMVLDAIDALDHPTGYEEFFLLTADTDLTPVLLRVRAHNRATVIYANEATAANYRVIADGMIEEAALVALLKGGEAEEEAPAESPPPAETRAPAAPPPAPSAVPVDRNRIEALARKVHGATNIPLFSPRTYADLFRHIAQEIAERGYHFQDTAENVTEKLVSVGRNVNRRQVLFVVKGLALKGHVFSTTDTPERLAEVFREQVLYLIGNTDLKLDESELALLPSWIVGRVSAAQAAAEPPPEKPAAAKLARRRPGKPSAPPPRQLPVKEPAPVIAAEAPAKAREPLPVAKERSPEPRETAKEAPPKADEAAPQPAPAAARPPPRKLDESRAAAAARLAAIGRPTGTPKPTARPAMPAKPASAPPRPAEKPQPSEGGESDDIGDEIQRIIASYSRARQQGDS